MADGVVVTELDARLLDVHLAHDIGKERHDADLADQRAELQIRSGVEKGSELPLTTDLARHYHLHTH